MQKNNNNTDMELTIVMPCLNESETLAQCITKAKNFLNQHNIHGEIIVADNCSTDHSQAIALQHNVKLVSIKPLGYGSAVMGGIVQANGQFVIIGDSDSSYCFSSLMPFLLKLRQGYDLVMGNRFAGFIEPGAMPFLHRYLGNPVLSFLGRLLFKSTIGDFHCGLRGFRKQAIELLQLETTGFEFASEMVVKATLHNLSITEIPTTLHVDGRNRPPHLKTWSDGWRHLILLIKMRLCSQTRFKHH